MKIYKNFIMQFLIYQRIFQKNLVVKLCVIEHIFEMILKIRIGQYYVIIENAG
jgi:hypothetical protein